jgi:hypothetical protein
MKEMDYVVLQRFLDGATIPKIKGKPKTFLGIAKQPHYENVLSNIYAFYFKLHEEHGLKDLFITSLIDCIKDAKIASKDFNGFERFKTKTEYPTKKGGRIDLLLYNDKQAIIIENKVYHELNNDLDDYWGSVELEEESDTAKIGIILSLKPTSKDLYEKFKYRDHYINITHVKLLNKVMENIGAYLSNTNEKYLTFLIDFHQNIKNISRPIMSKNKVNFYIQHKAKINDLVSLKYAYKTHVKAEVEDAGRHINNVKLVTPKKNSFNEPRLRYYQSTKHSELVYTIVFEDLLKNDNKLHIIVEPRESALKNGAIFKDITFNEDEEAVLRKEFYEDTDNGWSHFASKLYDLSSEDIADLGGFIRKKIKEDHFDSIMQKMEYYLVGCKRLNEEKLVEC